MKRILLLGSNGQLGHSCKEYLAKDVDLICASYSHSKNSTQIDISNEKKIIKLFKKTNPNIVINLSAYTDVDGCERNPDLAMRINFEGVKHICNHFNGHLIHISTDYVFDGKFGPYDENSITNPISAYGSSKLLGENFIRKNKNSFTILRTNVLYDYHANTKASYLKWVIDSLKNNKKINIVDDQWNNPTWTNSLAKIISVITKSKNFGLFHYADHGIMNRYEFTLLIAEIFDFDPSLIMRIKSKDLKQDAPRPKKSGLITKKIEKELRIKPPSVKSCLIKIKEQMSL